MKSLILSFISFSILISCGKVPEQQLEIVADDDDSFALQSVEPSNQSSEQIKSYPCPHDMVLVDHQFCPNLEQNCKKWLDKESCGIWGKDKSNKKYCKAMMPPMRCAEFYPSVCKSPAKDIIHVRACMNKYEGNNNPDEKPEAYVSFTEAENRCEEQGKRICTDKEWVSACEGDDNNPYSTGLVRPSNTQCNVDSDKPWKDPAKHTREQLSEVFASSREFPQCKTPSGIYQLSGNYDEWVRSTNPNTPYKSVLYSGHPLHVRNRCRKSTVSHGPTFSYYDISYRCCKNPK